MNVFCILSLCVFSNHILADQYTNDCSIISSDYSVLNNFDYQPISSSLLLQQITVLTKEMCGYQCLTNNLCYTATFKVILYTLVERKMSKGKNVERKMSKVKMSKDTNVESENVERYKRRKVKCRKIKTSKGKMSEGKNVER
jgi:hypothetical protein